MDKLKIIPEPSYKPQRVEENEVMAALEFFEEHPLKLQFQALILLGASSGMRPSELYKLSLDDINLRSRTVQIRHSKTGNGRITFFNKQCKKYLAAYIEEFKHNRQLKCLFGSQHIALNFKHAPIQVKDLRKNFAQTWTKRNGNFIALEQLLGHSIKKNVTMNHYALLNDAELKSIYDEVMN